MVIHVRPTRCSGMLIWELVVAMSILTAVFFPWQLSLLSEQKTLLAGYHRALAIGLVDGEMEVLAAGEWQTFKPGPQVYSVKASAATNLPPGQFTLTVNKHTIRLEWKPEKPFHGGVVWREATLP